MSNETSKQGRVVGIDLGTTNSLVAFMQDDAPVVIPGRRWLEPSTVCCRGPRRAAGQGSPR